MSWLLFRFALIGPFAGAIGYVAADQVLHLAGIVPSSLAQPHSFAGAFGIGGVLLLYSPIVAYPLGLGPAALAGLLHGQLLRRRSRNLQVLGRLLCGGAIGALVATPFALLFSQPGELQLVASMLRWASAGVVGGAAAGLTITKPVFAGLGSPQVRDRAA